MSNMSNDNRSETIVRTSVVGILGNVLLAGFKVFAGLLAHSPAIITDAVNNFSDAASSVVTIAGAKLAAKPADKKHPFGYGRFEYLGALVIGVLVLYAGIIAMRSGLTGIFGTQTDPEHSTVTLIIVAVAVAVKILLGRFFVKKGKETDSDSLVNSGKDALFDSIISASTLVSAAIFLFWRINLESYLAAVIAFFIMKAGFEMIRDTVSKLLGESGDLEMAKAIRKTILEFEPVEGVYDLVLNNYGPDAFSGSVHVSIPDTYSAWENDELIRNIQIKVIQEHNVILNAIGVYSINTKDKEIAEIEDSIVNAVKNIEFVKQIHGFHVNKKSKQIRFDVVISFDAKDRNNVYLEVLSKVQPLYPDYTFQIAVDTDYFES